MPPTPNQKKEEKGERHTIPLVFGTRSYFSLREMVSRALMEMVPSHLRSTLTEENSGSGRAQARK